MRDDLIFRSSSTSDWSAKDHADDEELIRRSSLLHLWFSALRSMHRQKEQKGNQDRSNIARTRYWGLGEDQSVLPDTKNVP